MTDRSSAATDLGANLHRLYLAGRTYVPDAANVYSDASIAVHSITPAVDALSDDLEHEVGQQISEILSTVHLALARTAINLDRAGTALVQIAERFSRTDLAARDEFDRLRRSAPALAEANSPPFTRPPMPGNAQPDISRGLVKGA